MRLNAGEQHFTRSVGDLVTRMPESTVNKTRRKTTRNQRSQQYLCVANFILSVYLIITFFLLSKIVEVKGNFICTLILCKRNEEGLLCHSAGLELNVEWSHVMLCSNTFSCKTFCKTLLFTEKKN